MAYVKEICVSRSTRMNMGNYEGVEHFVSMRAELDEFDVPEDEEATLERLVDDAMAEQLVRSYRARGKSGMANHAAVAKHHGLGACSALRK